MNTPLDILVILVVLGGIVVLLDHLSVGTERSTISVRDLPNTAITTNSPGTSAALAESDEVVTSPGARS